MKLSFKLSEVEIRTAIIEYIKKEKNVDTKSVVLSYHSAGNDPRETSYFTATASE